ncbi:MAG: outer membrane lipoprotein carrier protein LolA [bacterium]|nr:outer membrane lipoprotein carrier protein LolA [bacterium]
MTSSSGHLRNRFSIRLGFFALALFAPVLLGNGPATVESDAEVIAELDAIQTHYRGVRDLRADFLQRSTSAALGKTTELRGSVLVQRPGKMRWQYAPPDGRIIVLDGQSIRIFDPEDKQLQIAPMSEGTVSPTALSFLMGDGVLREIFSAERILAKQRPEIGLRLTSRDDASFEVLELWVDPKTHEMRESGLVDLFGNETRLVFEEMTENGGAEPAEFQIRVPDGTEVIDLR